MSRTKDAPKAGQRVAHVAVIAHVDKLAKKSARGLRRALSDAEIDRVTWLEVEKGTKATRAAEKALRKGADVVIVAGGDGTVRAAAEGLVGSDVPMAVLPVGTANLFASALHLPKQPADAIELIRSGSVLTLDTGICNDRTFNVMGGAGFDAAMIDSADDDKERLGTLAYIRAGAREARRRQPFEMCVEVDGSVVFEGEATAVLVGNIGKLKGGVEAFPDASPTDGKLDVAIVTASGVREWAAMMVTAVLHRQQASGHARLLQGEIVTVTFDERHRFELDGGVRGRAKRLEFSVAPASLRVCAPS